MSKGQKIRNPAKSLCKNQSQKNYSLHHLHALNLKLESDQIDKKKFLQKIKQQRLISQKISSVVNEEITKVQNDGVSFASRFQQQRRKNSLLTALVSHYQLMINKDKAQGQKRRLNKTLRNNYESFYESYPIKQNQQKKQNNQKILQQDNKKLKQLEKDLQQLIVKNNSSQYYLTKKLDEVRLLRSDRTVFNKIFDQFQNQLFQHQFQYKQLLIERSTLQSQFQQRVKQYQLINQRSEKQCDKLIQTHKKKLQIERNQFLFQQATRRSLAVQVESNQLQKFIKQNQMAQQNCKKKTFISLAQQFKQTNIESQNAFTFSEGVNVNCNKEQKTIQRFSEGETAQILKNEKTNSIHERKVNFKANQFCRDSSTVSNLKVYSNIRQQVQKPLIQEDNLEYERKVKDIFQELKINNVQQLPQLVLNLQQTIDKLHKQAESLYEKIYKDEKIIQRTHKNKKQGCKNKLGISNANRQQCKDKQNKQMQSFINQKQQLNKNIKELDNERYKINSQFHNFFMSQIPKLAQITQISQIMQPLNQIYSASTKKTEGLTQNKQNLINIMHAQQIGESVSKLESTLGQICPFVSRQDRSKIQKQEKSQYNHGVQKLSINSSSSKLSKRNPNWNNLGTNLGLGEHKTKQNKSKFVQQKQKQKQNDCQPYQDCYRQSQLQNILKLNKTTHNNTTIFTQSQLIQISKFNLNLYKNRRSLNPDNTRHSIANTNTNGSIFNNTYSNSSEAQKHAYRKDKEQSTRNRKQNKISKIL